MNFSFHQRKPNQIKRENQTNWLFLMSIKSHQPTINYRVDINSLTVEFRKKNIMSLRFQCQIRFSSCKSSCHLVGFVWRKPRYDGAITWRDVTWRDVTRSHPAQYSTRRVQFTHIQTRTKPCSICICHNSAPRAPMKATHSFATYLYVYILLCIKKRNRWDERCTYTC